MIVFAVIIVVINYKDLSQSKQMERSLFHIRLSMILVFQLTFRDCPVEEHATFYPYCDYIQRICGMDYIRRIVLEYGQGKTIEKTLLSSIIHVNRLS